MAAKKVATTKIRLYRPVLYIQKISHSSSCSENADLPLN